MSLADLINSRALVSRADDLPGVMVGTVLTVSPFRVLVPTISDGGLEAFGKPADAAVGDDVRVKLDEYGGLVVAAWEPRGPEPEPEPDPAPERFVLGVDTGYDYAPGVATSFEAGAASFALVTPEVVTVKLNIQITVNTFAASGDDWYNASQTIIHLPLGTVPTGEISYHPLAGDYGSGGTGKTGMLLATVASGSFNGDAFDLVRIGAFSGVGAWCTYASAFAAPGNLYTTGSGIYLKVHGILTIPHA